MTQLSKDMLLKYTSGINVTKPPYFMLYDFSIFLIGICM